MDQLNAKTYSEEVEITRLLFDRMKKENCLDEIDRETVSYRIAEIMVTAKQMYTRVLPRLINVSGESDSAMEDDLAGLQMNFVHLSDLMYEFQRTLMIAMKVPLDEGAQTEESESESEPDYDNEPDDEEAE